MWKKAREAAALQTGSEWVVIKSYRCYLTLVSSRLRLVGHCHDGTSSLDIIGPTLNPTRGSFLSWPLCNTLKSPLLPASILPKITKLPSARPRLTSTSLHKQQSQLLQLLHHLRPSIIISKAAWIHTPSTKRPLARSPRRTLSLSLPRPVSSSLSLSLLALP